MRYRFTLFVTLDCSGKALAQVYTALEDVPYNDYELVIVDVVRNSEKAKRAKITGTPSLLYHAKGGDVLIHDLSDHGFIRKVLGISRVR